MPGTTRVYLEVGTSKVFAVSLDWPGWCRPGLSEAEALEVLDDYRERYRAAVGATFDVGDLEVIGSVPGNRTTDFGAPDARGPWDDPAPAGAELARQITLLERCWERFDAVVATSSPSLRKGPRGGGRDRDAVADHVREAERAYASKIGTRVPPRTPWDEQRAVIVAALAEPDPGAAWPVGYGIRRIAWHVLDHAWEIEDKQE